MWSVPIGKPWTPGSDRLAEGVRALVGEGLVLAVVQEGGDERGARARRGRSAR